MSLWGNNDVASNSASYAPAQYGKAANSVNQTTLYGNTTAGAVINGKAVGQFGVSTAEMANTAGEAKKVTSAGWVLRESGTGSLESITISAGGTLYANADTISVTGTTNATATLTTNATGGITTVTLTNAGAGFTAVNPTVTITTATGSGATLVATAGGRAGRVSYETLVAMRSIGVGASDDSVLPQ